MSALSGQNIEDRLWVLAEHAFLPIKEGFMKRAVGNVVIPDVSLIVLLY
jgi:hypothetical protein